MTEMLDAGYWMPDIEHPVSSIEPPTRNMP